MKVKSKKLFQLALCVLLVLSIGSCSTECLAAQTGESSQMTVDEIRELCRNREYLKAFKQCEDVLKEDVAKNPARSMDCALTMVLIANETYSVKFGTSLYQDADRELNEKNFESSNEIDRFLRLGEAQKNYAVFLRLISKYSDSIKYFDKSIKAYDKALKNKSNPVLVGIGKAETYRLKGSLLTLIFDYEISKSCFENALAIVDEQLKSSPNSDELRYIKIRTLLDFADLESERGGYELAKTYLNSAFKLLEPVKSQNDFGPVYFKTKILSRLSSLSGRTSDKVSAMKYADEAVELANQAIIKWKDNPEASILYANINFQRLTMDKKKIPVEVRNKFISALESCIAKYPESYAIFRYILQGYAASASSKNYRIEDGNEKQVAISFNPLGSLANNQELKESLEIGQTNISVGKERSDIHVLSNCKTDESDFEFGLAMAALRSAQNLNPDSIDLMTDECALLTRQQVPFDMTPENIDSILKKIDSVLAKDDRFLRAHLVKMIVLNQPNFLYGDVSLEKLQSEREKEREILNRIIPERSKREFD